MRIHVAFRSSWMAIGWSISDAQVRSVATFLASSGLQAKGYSGILSDDGWDSHRGADGVIIPDPARWPQGMNTTIKWLHENNFTFGLYTAESSVACSGRPGSLYNEDIDARTFAQWEVDYIKNDNCAQCE